MGDITGYWLIHLKNTKNLRIKPGNGGKEAKFSNNISK